MSQAGVGIVIDELLTDEDLRIRFALDPIETVAELCLQGVELTRDEINLFCRTDARLWFVGDRVNAEWQQGTCTRRAIGPEWATLDQARLGEAILTRLIDEIITLLAQRETRRPEE
jgi:hypothetical protein